MTWWQSLLLIPYCLALGLLLLYGSHRYLIVRLYYRNRRAAPKPHDPPDPWPSVTVQLPVYNERYVVERLIRSVARLDYPGDRLEVQVLDDSTDDTADIAQACVEALRRDGRAISHVRRGDREGFKAGALAEGLKTAGGEFIAVFDLPAHAQVSHRAPRGHLAGQTLPARKDLHAARRAGPQRLLRRADRLLRAAGDLFPDPLPDDLRVRVSLRRRDVHLAGEEARSA